MILCAVYFESVLTLLLFFNAFRCLRANSEEGEEAVEHGVVIVFCTGSHVGRRSGSINLL